MEALKLPSGRTFDREDLRVIGMMHKHGTVRYSDTSFNLKAGGTSRVYFLGREDLTANPAYLHAVAERAYLHLYDSLGQPGEDFCLIGVPMAGGAIASAMAIANYIENDDEQFRFLTMRQVLKTHGANQTWVDGRPNDGDIVATVENVRTTGASENEALARIAKDGIPTDSIIRLSLVDRKLRPETDTMKTVYYLADIIAAFGHLGLWTPEQVEATLPEFLATE